MLEVAIFGVVVWGGFVLKDLLDRILVTSVRNENDIYQLTQEIRTANYLSRVDIDFGRPNYMADPGFTFGGEKPND